MLVKFKHNGKVYSVVRVCGSLYNVSVFSRALDWIDDFFSDGVFWTGFAFVFVILAVAFVG